jgi:hypothetical protein
VCNRQPGGRLLVEAGNTQLDAALSLGWTHLAAVGVDDDEVTMIGFALADNRSADLGEMLTSAELAMIEIVQAEGDAGLLAATSYSDEAIAAIRRSLESNLPAPGDAPTSDTLAPVFGVIVECADEAEQLDLLGRMREEGRRVRALMA